MQLIPICLDRIDRVDRGFQAVLVRLSERLQLGNHIAHHGPQIDRLAVEYFATGVDARNRKHIVDEALQAVGIALHRAERTHSGRR